MPLFTSAQIAKIRKHTGYIKSTDLATGHTYSSVPTGHMALFEKAVQREYRADDIAETFVPLLAELDELYPQRLPHKQSDGIEYRRLITGDTNRTDVQYRPESTRARKRAYLMCGNELCNLLGLPKNYRDPANSGYLNKEVVFPL